MEEVFHFFGFPGNRVQMSISCETPEGVENYELNMNCKGFPECHVLLGKLCLLASLSSKSSNPALLDHLFVLLLSVFYPFTKAVQDITKPADRVNYDVEAMSHM